MTKTKVIFLRVSPETFSELESRAIATNQSLNGFVIRLIEGSLSLTPSTQEFRPRPKKKGRRMGLFGDDEPDRVENPKQRVVDAFNREFPVGTKVILRRDSGEVFTEVIGAAYLHGRTPVAFFKNVSGCYAIEGRVRAYRNPSECRSTIGFSTAYEPKDRDHQ